MASAAKKTNKADKSLCRIITPEFRVSYPHVFKAQAVKPTDKPKFSITMLFPKDKSLVGQSPEGEPRSLKDVIRNAKLNYYGPKEEWPEHLLGPVIDGDDPKFKDKDGYKGHWVIKATTGEDQRPTVVDGEMMPITEANDFYPGCYARAYIYANRWEYMGKEGINFILDHVQKTRDGKPFGSKKSADQVFSPISPADDLEESEEMDFK